MLICVACRNGPISAKLCMKSLEEGGGFRASWKSSVEAKGARSFAGGIGITPSCCQTDHFKMGKRNVCSRFLTVDKICCNSWNDRKRASWNQSGKRRGTRPVGKRAVSHQHAACHQKPSDAACSENHRCCSARIYSFDFCNYGVELWGICENRWLTIRKRVVYPIFANTIIKILFEVSDGLSGCVVYVFEDENGFFTEQPYNGIFSIGEKQYTEIFGTFF